MKPDVSAKSIQVFSGNEVIDLVDREQARAMKAAGTHYFINHGHALRAVQALRTHQSETRGSQERSGCLTANESELSAEYRGHNWSIDALSRQYEHALESHILKGRKGTPRMCSVIAARVKTVLSQCWA